jgi:hypothetical protein
VSVNTSRKENSYGWASPPDYADQWFGFNDSGIEHFTGDPYSALARETAQNTNDAKTSAEDPAILDFDLFDISPNDLPNCEEFKELLGHCAKAADEESKTAKSFFSNATALLAGSTIRVLAIRDRNTTGIPGPCEVRTPYHSFMKSTGVSNKRDQTAGGSFGIGKNAPFALSEFRTILLRTRYRDSQGDLQELVQGKSVLMSHDVEGTRYSNIAYWGEKDGYKPLSNDPSRLPDWMTLFPEEIDDDNQTGTAIFVIGFRKISNWDSVLVAYIVQNFFSAIIKNQMICHIGQYTIDRTSLASIFQTDAVRTSVENFPNQPDQFDYSKHYADCILSSTKYDEMSEQLQLGKVKIGIEIGDELPKKVAIIRNGMLITDTLDGLKQFTGMKNFAAVVECTTVKGNELLRRMEPPAHNDFEPDRLLEEKERKNGRTALKKLVEFVRKELRRHAATEVLETVNLDELRELLGDEIGEETDLEGEINPQGNLKIAARPRPTRNRSGRVDQNSSGLGEGFDRIETTSGGTLDDNSVGDGAGGIPSGEGDMDGKGDGSDSSTAQGELDGDGDTSSHTLRTKGQNISLTGVRNILTSSTTRRVSFTPTQTAKISISFEQVGLEQNVLSLISSSSKGTIEQGASVIIDVTKGTRETLDSTFASEMPGAMKVIANAI